MCGSGSTHQLARNYNLHMVREEYSAIIKNQILLNLYSLKYSQICMLYILLHVCSLNNMLEVWSDSFHGQPQVEKLSSGQQVEININPT